MHRWRRLSWRRWWRLEGGVFGGGITAATAESLLDGTR
jgi:hypothetical protein